MELLQSMLDSKLGLFEVTGTDKMEGYAYIKDVFTGYERFTQLFNRFSKYPDKIKLVANNPANARARK
jgi:hypothetical protein